MVSHSALIVGTLRHALDHVFEPWWQQTLFRTQAQHLRFIHDSIWFVWFDTFICHVNCETENRKYKQFILYITAYQVKILRYFVCGMMREAIILTYTLREYHRWNAKRGVEFFSSVYPPQRWCVRFHWRRLRDSFRQPLPRSCLQPALTERGSCNWKNVFKTKYNATSRIMSHQVLTCLFWM